MNNFDEIRRVLGPLPLGPVVGGKPLDGDGMISVVDPATEEVITEIANGTMAETTTSVGVAHRAQDAWAEISPRSHSRSWRSLAQGVVHRLLKLGAALSGLATQKAGADRSDCWL